MNSDIPLAYHIPEAANLARASRTTIYRAIKAGELQARKRGTRTLILADELMRWVETLPCAGSTAR